MGTKTWVMALAACGLLACGGTRDRPTGTRNGGGAPNGSTRDSWVILESDGGQPSSDAGPTADAGSRRDGGAPVQLDPTEEVGALDQAEKAALCEIIVAAAGTETVNCDGLEVSPTTYEECLADPAPVACTVGDVTACTESLQGDPCNLFMTAACQFILQQCAE